MFRDDTPVKKFLKEHEFDFAAEGADEDSELAEAVRDVARQAESYEDLKPDPEKVVEAASEEFAANVGGVANPDPIVENADPNHDIADLDELLQYHFLRTGRRVDSGSRAEAPPIEETAAAATTNLNTNVGIRDFVDLLGDRLRTVDTDAAHEVQQFDGEIRGRVDWQETIKHRYSTGEPTGQTYACRVQRRDTLSARNRVLFDLLGELVELCEQFDRSHVGSDESFPAWLAEWDTDGALRRAVESGLSNAHFSRVDTSEVTANDRAIRTVRRDREALYREAAALLERLRTIQREGVTDDDDAADLFGMDVFVPEQSSEGESTIYELYWHFQIAAQFEASELRSIDLTDEENDLVAAWENEDQSLQYLQFNDWNGSAAVDGAESTEYLNFHPPDARDSDGPERGASRAGEVHQAWRQVRKTGLEKSFRTDKGTPDIVLLELDATADQPTIERLFVGEVKRTDSLHTIDEGIAQLAEYGAFAEVGDAVLADDPDADYVAKESEFLDTDRLELGLFVSSGHQVEEETDEIQLCWFDDPDDRDGSVDRPFQE